MSENYVAKVLNEIGVQLGMPAFTLDSSRRASLLFDEVLVTFAYVEEPAELLWIYVDLGEIDADDEAALSSLLQHSFVYWTRSEMTIGLDDSGHRAIGYTVIPVVNLRSRILMPAMRRFVENAMHVRGHIASGEYRDNVPGPVEATNIDLRPAFRV